MCIGMAFAMMEIKIVLAMLLQRFGLQIMPRTRVDYQVRITLSPKNGLPMIVASQDRQFDSTELRGTVRGLVDFAA